MNQLYKHQQEFEKENPDRALLVWEAGCLHPSTVITDYLTNKSLTIKQWCELGEGFYVKAYDMFLKKFVVVKADPPKMYPVSSFLKIVTADNEEVVVTPKHNILVFQNGEETWIPAEKLLTSSFLAKHPNELLHNDALQFLSFVYLLVSIRERNLFWWLSDVLHYLHKVLSCLVCYLDHYRQCDQRPLLVSNTDQDIFLAQAGVLSPCYPYSCMDGQESKLKHKKCTHFFSRWLSPLSKQDFYPQTTQNRETGRSLFEVSDAHIENSYPLVFLFESMINLIHKVVLLLLHQIDSLLYYKTKTQIRKATPIKTKSNYYDFHVPKYNNYVLNGIIHHNTGKTVGACVWLRQGRDSNALIVCPKRIVKKWEKELEKWGTTGTVISKETFKKEIKVILSKKWSSIVVDEADEFASPLFTKNRSQLATDMYTFFRENQNIPRLLLTATPIRSNPYNLHTILCYLGNYIDWQKWRARFFSLESRPYLRTPAWLPKSKWQKDIQPTLHKYANIVLLKDIVDKVPEEIIEIIKVKPKTKFVKDVDWTEPAKIFVEKHKHEQEEKVKKILEISKNFRKVLVVAHYVEQVKDLEQKLSKNRKTYCVHGGIKDQESILQEANESEECFLIVQASLGAGFDADTFPAMIFASMSYKVRDYVQMKARVKRIHNLHDVYYYYLIGGSCDKGVLDTIKKGRDFVPSEYLYDTTKATTSE